jgi:hypothetical protein
MWKFAVFLLIFWMPSFVMGADLKKLDVHLRVLDETGRPIPFVTVWSAVAYQNPTTDEYVRYKRLSHDDLWGAAKRYGYSHEFASPYWSPVDGILYPGMTDQKGEFVDHLTGSTEGRYNQPISPPVSASYVFFSDGYAPAIVDFALDGRDVESTVVLKPTKPVYSDRADALKFAAIRHELTDEPRFVEVSEAGERRLADVEARLQSLAESAERQGDRLLAAHIYARMELVPVLTRVDGKLAGYRQIALGAPDRVIYLDKAIALAPDDPYIAMIDYLRSSSRDRAAFAMTDPKQLDAHLAGLDKFIDAVEIPWLNAHPDAWQRFKMGLVTDLRDTGRLEEARRRLDRLQHHEPKGYDYAFLRRMLDGAEEIKRGEKKLPADRNGG